VSDRRKQRLRIGWGCVAAAAVIMVVCYDLMGPRVSRWRFDDPPAAIAVRVAVIILVAAAVFIIPGRRRDGK
jgi:hypothetical protein